MFSLKKSELLIESCWLLAGNIILAIGVAWFILPNDVLTGGLAGVAIAIEPIFHITPEIVINVVLFLLGAVILGKRFAAKTIFSTFAYPMFLSLFSYLANHVIGADVFIMDKYLATIYGGALMGIGIGCVFRTGASTGGMDIPPLILNKYTHLPLPSLVMLIDALTVLLGAMVYGLQPALMGILSVWVSSFMINKTLMIGGQEAKNVMIISNKHKEIMEYIHKELNRGTTLLQAVGGYSQEKRPVIMAVIVKKQLHDLQMIVSHIDPEAFVIVTDTNEVQGLGFTYKEEL